MGNVVDYDFIIFLKKYLISVTWCLHQENHPNTPCFAAVNNRFRMSSVNWDFGRGKRGLDQILAGVLIL